MPTYEYKCKNCGVFEIKLTMSDFIEKCPDCKSNVSRVYSVSGVHFNGSGFYSTDSKGE